MRVLHQFITATSLLALVACASSPDKMGAADVSPIQFQNYDCTQIASESDRIGRRVNVLYDQLKKEANADAWQMGVGMVLFWPALFFLEGGDGPQATEYRQLKGEYEALQRTSIVKKCGLDFRDFDAEFKAKAKTDKPVNQETR
jgi:hypothetical protein